MAYKCACGRPYFCESDGEGPCHDVCKRKGCERLTEESGVLCDECQENEDEENNESV
jgi:hypothetical protein